MFLNKYYLTMLLILMTFATHAQKRVKWGKYSEEIFQIYGSELAKDAEAVILYESGALSLESGKYLLKVHRRMIILEESGISRGQISIVYNPKEERITGLEGITTNVSEGNNYSIKLRTSSIEIEEISESKAILTFNMPDVQVGSIIEYRYQKKSNSISKPEDWYFQHDIPTLYSAYSQDKLPRTLKYLTSLQGQLLFAKYNDIGLKLYELTDVPPLNDRITYLANAVDYLEKISFRSTSPDDFSSWNRFVKEYYENKDVDRVVNEGQGIMQLTLKNLGINEDDPLIQKSQKIYDEVQKTLKWSGIYDIYPNGKGNSAEVNLSLFTLLKSLNNQTFMVLLTTPPFGKIHRSYPLPTPFDHVIVQTIIDGKIIYLDATNPYLPFGHLDTYSENRECLVLKDTAEWSVSAGLNNGKETIFQQVKFENGNLQRQYQIKWDVLASAKFRKVIDEGSSNRFFEDMFDTPDRGELKTAEVVNKRDITKPLSSTFSYQEADYLKGQNKVYFQHVEYKKLIENSFPDAKRYYPVNFPSFDKTHLTSTIEIPKGYQVASIPESMNISLPENYGKFSYTCVVQQNQLNLSVKFEIYKNNLPPDLYSALHEFYSQMVAKCKEPVIFVKQ